MVNLDFDSSMYAGPKTRFHWLAGRILVHLRNSAVGIVRRGTRLRERRAVVFRKSLVDKRFDLHGV